ncbi:MAG: FtsX-like permease family protein [Pseudomonadota bacterium]
MTWLSLAWANLRNSPLSSAINVLLMALGTLSIVLLLLVSAQLSERLSRDARGIDLVLGAQGSPVQLVLSAVYHADLPPGNIPLEAAERWIEDPRIATAVPLALGDSHRGFRIVGTTESFLSFYSVDLAVGTAWQRPLEAVLGATVAQQTGMAAGSRFAGVHGMAEGGHVHEQQPYTVTGVLAPTGTIVDRLILTSLQSVWELHESESAEHDHATGHEHDGAHDAAHDDEHEGEHESDDAHDDEHEGEHEHDAAHDDEHEGEHEHDAAHDDEHEGEHEHDGAHDDEHEGEHEHDGAHQHGNEPEDAEITAVLLRYQTPLAALTLPREVNAEGQLQAAAPAVEIARVLTLLGVGIDGLRAFAWVLVLTAALSVFAALYGSLYARRLDLALLRCLGASRLQLLSSLLLEGMLLSLLGVALGFLVGHGLTELLGTWLEKSRGISLTGWVWLRSESLILVTLIAVGALAAAIPAIQAYRTDVARTLAEA